MAGAFVGKWTVDLSTTTGLEEFGAACGLNAEKVEKLAKLKYAIEYGLSGDTLSVTVTYYCDFPAHTYTFKLGDTFDYHAVDGSDPKLTVTMDGEKMVEDYKLGESSWKTVREVEKPNVMTATTTCLGVTVVQKMMKE